MDNPVPEILYVRQQINNRYERGREDRFARMILKTVQDIMCVCVCVYHMEKVELIMVIELSLKNNFQ